jgi:hypothetical protein
MHEMLWQGRSLALGGTAKRSLTVSLGELGHVQAHTVKGFPNTTGRVWEPFGRATQSIVCQTERVSARAFTDVV